MNHPLTRRQVLAGGLLGATALSGIRRAAAVAPAGSDLGAVEHVVFLMQENRSFDHYFGAYPGVRGFDDHPRGSLGAFAQPYPGNTTRSPKGVLLPFHMDTQTGKAECPTDLTHAWKAQHECWNGGKMDAFVKVHASAEHEGPEIGVHTMGYYRRPDVPYYWALADAFTICDNYHCSVIGPTHPNRLMWMSATVDPHGRNGGPVLSTESSSESMWSVDWKTMPEALEDAGVSWKVYSAPGTSPANSAFIGLETGDAILPYFKQYKDPTSALYQKAFLPQYPSDFAADVLADRLPSVSWITAESGYDEHPPAPSGLGEFFTSTVLSALTANPKVWAKTVFFLMYDENDGFFDHVAPPVPARGTADEYVTVRPLPATAGGIDGPIGLGFRVPMLVLSPFSRGGHIVSEVFDHTSQLRFLETRFGVRVPNLSAWRRSVTGDLTSTLRLSHPDTTVPTLPTTSAVVLQATEQCTPSEEYAGSGGNNPEPPSPQVMPVQDRRTAATSPASAGKFSSTAGTARASAVSSETSGPTAATALGDATAASLPVTGGLTAAGPAVALTALGVAAAVIAKRDRHPGDG